MEILLTLALYDFIMESDNMKTKIFLFGSVLTVLFLTLSFSGCTELGVVVANIGDINENPLDYIGKELTVKGTCEGSNIFDDKGHSIRYEYKHFLNGDFALTGTIWNHYLGYTYLDVETVRAI